MRLLRLHVRRYGHFVNVPFDFDGKGLKLVLGPNEAGKTTLLQFIRELLFGFGERNTYDFGHGRLEGEATLRLASGEMVELRRHKGRKNNLSVRIDGRETPHNDGSFNALLGNASATLFRSVFAFGLAELAAGEKSLADESVRSALYSGGVASVGSPKKILDALESEAGALFREKAHKTALINALSGELKALQKQVNERSIRCEAYEDRRAELDEAAARARDIEVTVNELTRKHSLASKLSKALPLWLEWKALSQDRQGLHVPEGFPVDGKEQYLKLEEEIDRLKQEQVAQQEETADTERALEKVAVDPRLNDYKADIEHIQQKIQSVKDARRDLPVREGEKAAALRAVESELAESVPGWTTDALDEFRLTAAAAAELDLLTHERERLERSKTALETDRLRLAKDLRNAKAELAQLGDPVDVSGLAVLLESQAEYATTKKELARLHGEERKAARELAALLPRLNPPLAGPTALCSALPVPHRETVDQFKLDFARIEKDLSSAELMLVKERTRLAALKKELVDLNAGGAEVPTAERLVQLRARRDVGWSLIRRKYVENQEPAREISDWLAEEGTFLPDVYEAAVRISDQYADRLFDKSRSVAKRDEIRISQEQVKDQEASLRELRELHNSVKLRWEELWRPCGFVPFDPEAMTAWLESHNSLCQVVERISHLTGEARVLTEQVASFTDRLRSALEQSNGDDASLLVVGRQRVEAAIEREKQRSRLNKSLATFQSECGEVNEKLADDEKHHQAWNLRRQAVLRSLALPEEWDLGLARNVIARLAKVQVRLQSAREKETQIAELKSRLEAFDPLVRRLCAELAPELLEKPTDVAASTLRDHLSAYEQRILLQEKRDSGRKKLRELERKRKIAQDRASGLLDAAGASTASEFIQVAERAKRIAQLDAELSAKEREVAIIRENEPADSFEQQLQEADLGVLGERLRDLASRLEGARAEKTRADQQVGSCQRALAELGKGSGEAAALMEEMASRRAGLAAAVDRYVPLVFGRHLLQQAIERFEQDSQPEMLREVTRIFQSVTGNRYIRVERPLAESAPLLVHRGEHEILEPSQLSTGTREQLYLAIRLAYVLHYCGRAEPLPIIMDDVLANFDDERARETLRGLGELAHRVQIIMFTCHPHLAKLANEVFPDLSPIHISCPETR